MSTILLEQVWPEWKVVGRIGRGAFGEVYEAVRQERQMESRAAIKVISIPRDESEIESLRAEGMTEDATRSYFENVVHDFTGEIQMLESLKGMPNIVGVEDYKVVEKEREIGWTIFIRMELLIPLIRYTENRRMDQGEVVRLGRDICAALERCARRNVIHRDIKPENIFVNQDGDFKLGDFGIARKLETQSAGFSQKGTPNYMAPEVQRGEKEYDAGVDIYSLGLVLYWLMNEKRLPFLFTEEQRQSPRERDNALRRRMSGEPLPPPCQAPAGLAEVILRACAYDPSCRYASAEEMGRALDALDARGEAPGRAGGSAPEYLSGAQGPNGTIRVNRGSAQPSYVGGQSFYQGGAEQMGGGIQGVQVGSFGDQRGGSQSRGFSPKVILGAMAAVILAAAGIIALPGLLEHAWSGGGEDTEETVELSDYDKEKIDSILAEAEDLAEEEDYAGALIKVQSGLITYPDSQELQERQEQYDRDLETYKEEQEKALEEAAQVTASESAGASYGSTSPANYGTSAQQQTAGGQGYATGGSTASYDAQSGTSGASESSAAQSSQSPATGASDDANAAGAVVGQYLRAFVSDVNSGRYREMYAAVEPGSKMEETQQSFIENTNLYEELLDYEIVSRERKDAGTYHVTAVEYYDVAQLTDGKQYELDQKCVYKVRRQSDGSWKIADLIAVDVLDKREY